jgi:hypothetical protein
MKKTGLVIDSESINDMGLMLGVGFHWGYRYISNVNIDLNFEKRNYSRISQQNYANISIGFHLMIDGLKRKFNQNKMLILRRFVNMTYEFIKQIRYN